MGYNIFALSVLTAIFMLFACRPTPDTCLQELDRIDSLTTVDAQRSIVVLDSLQPQIADEDSSTWAYYQLLKIKAQDRALIPHTSDAVILKVIDYYKRHPQGDKLAWAYCYGGRVYRDMNDMPRALEYLHKSLTELEDGRNPALQQRVLNQVGYIFYHSFLYAESRAIRRQVINADSLLGNFDRMMTSYTDMARSFIAEEQYDSAALVSRYVSVLAKQHQLHRFEPALRLLDAQVAEYQGKHQDAIRIIEPFLHDSISPDPTPFLSTAVRAMMAMQMYDDVEPLCCRLLNDSHTSQARRAKVLHQLADIDLAHGCDKKALAHLSQALSCLDSLVRQEKQEKVRLINDFYANRLREQQFELLRQERDNAQVRIYLLSFVLVCLLLIALTIWLQYRRRKAERLLTLEQTLASFKRSDLYYCLHDTFMANHAMPIELWEEVEGYVEDNFPEFLTRMRKLTDYSETEWQVTLFTFLGLRNTEIATLLNRHRSAISLSKKRLYEKVRGTIGKAEDWDNIINNS